MTLSLSLTPEPLEATALGFLVHDPVIEPDPFETFVAPVVSSVPATRVLACLDEALMLRYLRPASVWGSSA